MLSVLRHLVSILLLPFVMVVVIPYWITGGAPRSVYDGSTAQTIGRIAGALLFIAGFALFAWCVSLFATKGKGTLAPWDPTKELVAVGPYRHTRNPMISGVLAMLAGETVFFGSETIASWFLVFWLINQTYFLILEEPGLERRFGASYLRYKEAVPRWIPRLTPWKDE